MQRCQHKSRIASNIDKQWLYTAFLFYFSSTDRIVHGSSFADAVQLVFQYLSRVSPIPFLEVIRSTSIPVIVLSRAPPMTPLPEISNGARKPVVTLPTRELLGWDPHYCSPLPGPLALIGKGKGRLFNHQITWVARFSHVVEVTGFCKSSW